MMKNASVSRAGTGGKQEEHEDWCNNGHDGLLEQKTKAEGFGLGQIL
jgi:hypothetical protein